MTHKISFQSLVKKRDKNLQKKAKASIRNKAKVFLKNIFFRFGGFGKRTGGIFCCLLLGIIILDPTALVFADENIGFLTQSSEDMAKGLGTLLSIVVRMLSFISMFVISVSAELMSTELLLGDSAMSGIQVLWRFVLNITNIGFVLVLLYLAFANMFLAGDGDWSIKTKLPRIIIALVAINFSLLFFRVAIQVVDIGTVAILSIADDKVNAKDIKGMLSTPVNDITAKGNSELPFYKVFNKAMNCNENATSLATSGNDCLFFIDPSKNKTETTRNIMLAFAVNFLDLEQMPALSVKLGKISSVVDSVLFSSIMSIAYAMALLAMFFVMLYRVAALWFFMAFSPAIVAAMALGIGGGSGGTLGTKLITYLLVPLKIAAIFAITFVMTGVMLEHTVQYSANFLQAGSAIRQFTGGDGNLFNILWKILTVAIFWKGAFIAMDGTDAEEMVKGIQSATNSVGSYALKTATVDQPLFSVGQNGEKASLSALGSVTGRLPSIRGTKIASQTSNIIKSIPSLNQGNAAGQVQADSAMNRQGTPISLATDWDGVKKAVKDISVENMQGNSNAFTTFVDKLRPTLKNGLKTKLSLSSNASEEDIVRALSQKSVEQLKSLDLGFKGSTSLNTDTQPETGFITIGDTRINYTQNMTELRNNNQDQNTSGFIKNQLRGANITKEELEKLLIASDNNKGEVAEKIISDAGLKDKVTLENMKLAIEEIIGPDASSARNATTQNATQGQSTNPGTQQ